MITENFKKTVKTEIARLARRLSVDAHDAFLIWFATALLEMPEDEALEAVSLEGANDKGIDLFWIDEDEERVIIVQGKYSPDYKVNVKERHVDALTASLDWLANPETLRREGKEDLAVAAKEYLEAIKEGYPTELSFVYTATRNKNIEKKLQVYNSNPLNRDSNKYLRHYHGDMLNALWEELKGTGSRIPSDKLKFVSDETISYDGTYGEALMGSIPASELQRLYRSYGDQLFDRNVRLYLGSRGGSVNAGILETLDDEQEKENFWAYNNGITFICDSFEISETLIEMKNFSIINGCQTTVSISKTSQDLINASVLCRVIASPHDIVDNIIRYNNSQNPIKMWDIASQDKTQRRLKSEFENLKKPYIYLTRRGSRPKEGLKKFRDSSGRLRQIRIDVAGQYCAAYKGFPVVAYKEKGLIFSKYREEVFPPDVNVTEVLFQWSCGDVASEMVKEAIRTRGPEEAKILKKGGALFVAAIMGRIIRERNGATFESKMSVENVASERCRSRLKKYGLYALTVYLDAVEDVLDREGVELTTILRSPDYFHRIVRQIMRRFERESMGRKWMDEALPKLFQ